MESKEKQIKKLEESIANNQKELKIMKGQVVVHNILDELKEQLGDELENIVLDYFQFSLGDGDENIPDTDTESENTDIYGEPDSKYSEYELHFYVKNFPKSNRDYKYGVKGIRYRPECGHPFSFQDYSWLTKKRLYRSFKSLAAATSYATGVWEKYPTYIIFEN